MGAFCFFVCLCVFASYVLDFRLLSLPIIPIPGRHENADECYISGAAAVCGACVVVSTTASQSRCAARRPQPPHTHSHARIFELCAFVVMGVWISFDAQIWVLDYADRWYLWVGASLFASLGVRAVAGRQKTTTEEFQPTHEPEKKHIFYTNRRRVCALSSSIACAFTRSYCIFRIFCMCDPHKLTNPSESP